MSVQTSFLTQSTKMLLHTAEEEAAAAHHDGQNKSKHRRVPIPLTVLAVYQYVRPYHHNQSTAPYSVPSTQQYCHMVQRKRMYFSDVFWRKCLWVLICLSSSLVMMIPAEEVVVTPEGDIEAVQASESSSSSSTYGVDVSWPMHHRQVQVSTKEGMPLAGDSSSAMQRKYSEFIKGCQQQPDVEKDACEMYESDRLEMNLLQPRAMENYTHAGYAKVKAPAPVLKLLKDFWNANHGREIEEVWDTGNTYVNHWDIPTSMLDLGGRQHDLKNGKATFLTDQQRWMLVQQVQAVLEQWTRQSLVFTSLYGIRIYHEGAILASHVDRLPLVTSAIINVAQSDETTGDDDEEEEPWVLEVIGHDGKASNITMEPGDMVLYESHSVIHGRPYPLRGSYYANVFFHFEPFGHTARHTAKRAYGSDGFNYEEHTKAAYEKALERQHQEEEDNVDTSASKTKQEKTISSPGLPPYIHPSEETQWKQNYYFERVPEIKPKSIKTALGLVRVHSAAADGNVEALKDIAARDRSQLFLADHNGWRPLHEAARTGQVEALKFLIKEGAQINERTNGGDGGSALWWAERHAEDNQEAIALLKKHGAVSLAPKKIIAD